MNRFSPACLGLCFLLGACSGQANADGTPDPTAGSAGMVGVAGEPTATGGAPEAGGAPSVAGGGSGGDAVAGGGMGGEPELGGTGGTPGSAGSGGVGGKAGTSGSAGAAGAPTSGSIDFSIWQLQLPVGAPDTVSPKSLPTYSSAYFKKAGDGGYVFMDPKTGVTTGGSQHPRSELRETNASGGEAAWTSSGTNTMTVSGQALLLSGGSKGSTTVAQVFVSGSNTLLELQYNGSQFKVFYEESKGNGEPTVTLAGTFAMKTKYTFTVGYSANKLTVSINGKMLYTKTPSSAVSGKKFYFKTGNYDQTASSGTASTTPYTEIEAYTIDVVHG